MNTEWVSESCEFLIWQLVDDQLGESHSSSAVGSHSHSPCNTHIIKKLFSPTLILIQLFSTYSRPNPSSKKGYFGFMAEALMVAGSPRLIILSQRTTWLMICMYVCVMEVHNITPMHIIILHIAGCHDVLHCALSCSERWAWQIAAWCSSQTN